MILRGKKYKMLNAYRKRRNTKPKLRIRLKLKRGK